MEQQCTKHTHTQTAAAVQWKAGRRGADCAGVHRAGAWEAREAHAAAGRVGFWKMRKEKKTRERE